MTFAQPKRRRPEIDWQRHSIDAVYRFFLQFDLTLMGLLSETCARCCFRLRVMAGRLATASISKVGAGGLHAGMFQAQA
jgi:hypothetical protein